MSERWQCKCGRTVPVDVRPETRYRCDSCGELRSECQAKPPANFDWLNRRPQVVDEHEHKRATLADLQRAIRGDPLMNAYYVMFLRGDFASFEDFLVNLAFGLARDRKRILEALMRATQTKEVVVVTNE